MNHKAESGKSKLLSGRNVSRNVVTTAHHLPISTMFSSAHSLNGQLRGAADVALAENFQGQGRGAQGAEQEQRPADRPPLAVGEAVRQQETEAGADSRTRAGDQSQLRKRDLGFAHDDTSRAGEASCSSPRTWAARNRPASFAVLFVHLFLLPFHVRSLGDLKRLLA